MFAEGSTTNGTSLLKFKKGAFYAMRPVTPCYIKFGNCLVRPCYDILNFWHMVILLLSSFSIYSTHLYIMPNFVPNDYMIEHFAKYVYKD